MTDPTTIEHVLSVEIHAPVQKVWDEITKTGSIQRPLYNTVLHTDFEPGSRLRYSSGDGKRVFVVGEIVEVRPPTLFSHTYRFTQRDEPFTLVTWQLEETPTGCRVTLTHGGFTDRSWKPEKVKAGWEEILGLLKSEVETGRIPFRTRLMYRIMNAMMFMMPKATKAEEVAKKGW